MRYPKRKTAASSRPKRWDEGEGHHTVVSHDMPGREFATWPLVAFVRWPQRSRCVRLALEPANPVDGLAIEFGSARLPRRNLWPYWPAYGARCMWGRWAAAR
jgi:hypothetical protein